MATRRTPQLPLRLDTAKAAADAAWHAGACIAYLGTALYLTLDTACRTPERIGDELHLPLPPAATPRQICDATESWLRDEALSMFARIIMQKSALAGRHLPRPPRIALIFGKRSHWVRHEKDILRCHWRLIEQSPAVIEQVLERAVAALQPAPLCDDLFALV